MTSYQYRDFCRIASDELLRKLASDTKRKSMAFYAKAELARRDLAAALVV